MDMKRKLLLHSLSFFVLAVFFTFSSCAQDAPKSPPATATGKIGAANVTINYSSPAVNGRLILNELLVMLSSALFRRTT